MAEGEGVQGRKKIGLIKKIRTRFSSRDETKRSNHVKFGTKNACRNPHSFFHFCDASKRLRTLSSEVASFMPKFMRKNGKKIKAAEDDPDSILEFRLPTKNLNRMVQSSLFINKAQLKTNKKSIVISVFGKVGTCKILIKKETKRLDIDQPIYFNVTDFIGDLWKKELRSGEKNCGIDVIFKIDYEKNEELKTDPRQEILMENSSAYDHFLRIDYFSCR